MEAPESSPPLTRTKARIWSLVSPMSRYMSPDSNSSIVSCPFLRAERRVALRVRGVALPRAAKDEFGFLLLALEKEG